MWISALAFVVLLLQSLGFSVFNLAFCHLLFGFWLLDFGLQLSAKFLLLPRKKIPNHKLL